MTTLEVKDCQLHTITIESCVKKIILRHVLINQNVMKQIANSKIKSLDVMWCSMNPHNIDWISYIEWLTYIIINCRTLRQLSMRNDNIAYIPLFEAINNSKIRLLIMYYPIHKYVYDVLIHNTRLIKLSTDSSTNPDKDLQPLLQRKFNENCIRYKSIIARCVIILSSKYLCKDLRRLIVETILDYF